MMVFLLEVFVVGHCVWPNFPRITGRKVDVGKGEHVDLLLNTWEVKRSKRYRSLMAYIGMWSQSSFCLYAFL